jgi:membrane protein
MKRKVTTEKAQDSGYVVRRLRVFVDALRRRVGWVDHAIRAGVRYDHADGARLAAAVTYYAFFAVFSLALLGFAIIGYLVRNPALLAAMQDQLPGNLPRLDPSAIRHARGPAIVIGFVVWPISGVLWVDALRSSMRAVWELPQYPGRFFLRQLINLAVLAGIGLLLAVSLAAAVGTQHLLGWLLFDLADVGAAGSLLADTVGFAVSIATSTVLAVVVLSRLPRLRIPARRVLGPALLIGAGVQALTSIGRIYVNATQANPAYHLVATAVGLLVFLNLLNQLILYACALAATGTAGHVTDLAANADPAVAPSTPPSPSLSEGRAEHSAVPNPAESNEAASSADRSSPPLPGEAVRVRIRGARYRRDPRRRPARPARYPRARR